MATRQKKKADGAGGGSKSPTGAQQLRLLKTSPSVNPAASTSPDVTPAAGVVQMATKTETVPQRPSGSSPEAAVESETLEEGELDAFLLQALQDPKTRLVRPGTYPDAISINSCFFSFFFFFRGS